MSLTFEGHKHVDRPSGDRSGDWFAYTCSFCNHDVSGAIIASSNNQFIKWLQCPICGRGSVYHHPERAVHPGVPFGSPIEGLPERVKEAYEEARQCMSVNAFTACELICRNILMYVAVEKGADKNGSFAYYVNYLADQGYVTPPMRPWVDLIRDHGNKAAHDLDKPSKDRAESTIKFTAALLNLIYEMDHLTKQFVPVIVPTENNETKKPDEGE